MKMQILWTMVFVAISISGTLSAQNSSTNQNGKSPAYIIKVENSGTGCIITYNYEVKGPREVGSGLPTGKRMHRPFTVRKDIDNTARIGVHKVESPKDLTVGQSAGRMAFSDLTVTTNCGGRVNKLSGQNGEFTLPSDLPNGECIVVVSWSWGAGTKRVEVPVTISVENSVCFAIKEQGVK